MGIIINVASNEYFKGVSKHLKSRVITCEFKDGGRVISVFAKRARGLMVKFAVQQRIQTVEDVKKFDLEGYSYSEKDSSDDVFVFSRAKKPSKSNVAKKKDASKPEKKRRKVTKVKLVFVLQETHRPKTCFVFPTCGSKVLVSCSDFSLRICKICFKEKHIFEYIVQQRNFNMKV